MNVQIDFGKTAGKIKPLHGVNSGPKTKVFTYDASELFRKAGIPSSRLHDVEYPYGSGEFVDVHCVFPVFDADENDPASYNFGLTDHYLQAILDAGTKIFYRLGESIEHAPVKRHVYPPKDYEKWARICEHIIRHYNEGWADGFHWNIEYWEIWNEPDQCGPISPTWCGTTEQFFDFYETAAKYLKNRFPHLKIGGPALAGTRKWAAYFMDEMAKRNAPLDFFSWHIYTHSAELIGEFAEEFYEMTRKYGFTETELILNEWNYMEHWNDQPPSYKKLIGMTGAAHCGAVFATLQHCHVDSAAYFEADVIKEWCGLFEVQDMAIGSSAENSGKLKPRKPFYAFCAFNELYKLGNEAECTSDYEHIYPLAATDGTASGAMITAYHAELSGETDITLKGLKPCTITLYLTNREHDDECMAKYTCTGTEYRIRIPLHDEEI